MKRTQFWLALVALVLAMSVLAYRFLDGIEDRPLDLLLPAVVAIVLLLILRRSASRPTKRP